MPPGTCGPAWRASADSFLIVGSHIDAVPNGGWLDGVLGLLTALETMRQLATLRRPAADRRPVRRLGRRGRRAVRSQPGRLLGMRRHARSRRRADAGRRRRRDARRRAGQAAASTSTGPARRPRRSTGAVAYLELHIEQGPVLLETGRLASAVSGTVGVERHLVTFTGQAAHAGSTPMLMRRDSLAAAAQAALEIRESAITPRRRRHRRPDALHPGRDHGGRRRDRDAARPAPPRRRRAGRDARRRDGRLPRRGRGVRLRRSRSGRCSAATPTPFDPALVAIARSGRRRCRRRRRRPDPQRAAPRRHRDRPDRPHRDDLRPVRPAGLARRDRGLARGRAARRDRRLRAHRRAGAGRGRRQQ